MSGTGPWDEDALVQNTRLAILRSLTLLRQTNGQAERTAHMRALVTGICRSWQANQQRSES